VVRSLVLLSELQDHLPKRVNHRNLRVTFLFHVGEVFVLRSLFSVLCSEQIIIEHQKKTRLDAGVGDGTPSSVISTGALRPASSVTRGAILGHGDSRAGLVPGEEVLNDSEAEVCCAVVDNVGGPNSIEVAGLSLSLLTCEQLSIAAVESTATPTSSTLWPGPPPMAPVSPVTLAIL
jgi:hypothetical protein